MHILLVIDCLGSGGAQFQVVNLASAMHQLGHRVEVFTYYPQYNHFLPELERWGIPCHAGSKKHRFSLSVCFVLRRLLKSRGFDIVMAFLPTPAFYCEVSRLGLRRPLVIVSERSTYASRVRWRWVWIAQQAHRLADHIVVNSIHQRDRMIAEFPWMRGKSSTIWNGISVDRYCSEPPASNGGTIRFLSIGRVVERKNVHGLVEALRIYRDAHGEPPRVAWAGRLPLEEASGEYRARIDELLGKYGLKNYWTWLGERRDIPDVLGMHDALIHPSFFEGLPNAICEALASGRPVLASDIGDHRRLVGDGVRGYLFPPENPTGIADAMRRFSLLGISRRLEMGQNARQFALEELNLGKAAERFVSLFENLLQSIKR